MAPSAALSTHAQPKAAPCNCWLVHPVAAAVCWCPPNPNTKSCTPLPSPASQRTWVCEAAVCCWLVGQDGCVHCVPVGVHVQQLLATICTCSCFHVCTAPNMSLCCESVCTRLRVCCCLQLSAECGCQTIIPRTVSVVGLPCSPETHGNEQAQRNARAWETHTS